MSLICPLFSSSSGNSTYISTKNGNILIDAGASMKSIKTSIESIGGDFESIKAVAVTHTHSDHISGIRPVLNKTKAKLIATKETADYLIKNDKIPASTEIVIIGESKIDVFSNEISAFATSHDADGSCGYSITFADGKKFSLCTDLGVITDSVHNAITGSDAILLESNHDIDMLKKGPYPPHLKARILSDIGHISNAICAEELKKLLKTGTTRFILGHLSQHNNTPLLALTSAESACIDLGAKNGVDYKLVVAKPKDNGVTIL